MRLSYRLGLGLTTLIGLTACTNPEFSPFGGNRVDWASARQMIGSESEFFTAARLADIVEASYQDTRRTPTAPDAKTTQTATTETEEEAVRRLDRAFANFARSTYVAGGSDEKNALLRSQYRMRDARNTIQDQLIAASNNRCNVYKTQLTRFSTGTQFGLGSVATIAGGVGALLSGGATQAASAVAGIASGVNAEFQKDFMANVMTNVIIPGIDRQRADLRNQIVKNSCRSISEYPLPLAIAETIRYHGACNINVGIATSGQAVTRTQPDSLEAVLAAVKKAGDINKALAAANAPPAKPGAAAKPAPADAPADLVGAADEPKNNQPQKATAEAAPQSSPPLLGDELKLETCPPLTPSGRPYTKPASG